MRNVIGCLLSAACFSLVLPACSTEHDLLSPAVQTPLHLAALSSTTDPIGDTDGNGVPGQAYQDIVQAGVDAAGGVFTFTMDVAANVPAEPTSPGGITLMTWSWNLNTIPTAFPSGYPFAPGTGLTAPPEFIVWVFWNGTEFGGSLIDRRPLLVGGEAAITSIDVDIHGATLTATVDASLLDNPSGFLWIARTSNWHVLGTQSLVALDLAPDLGPVSWP
jgi:hypothetical protein